MVSPGTAWFGPSLFVAVIEVAPDFAATAEASRISAVSFAGVVFPSVSCAPFSEPFGKNGVSPPAVFGEVNETTEAVLVKTEETLIAGGTVTV